jgi:adenylate kinase
MNIAEEELDGLILSAMEEYKLQIEGVKDTCKGFIYVVDGNKIQDFVLEEIARMLRLHTKSNAPRRAPRIVITGPPGSGRSLQASKISEKYETIHVKISSLLKDVINSQSDTGKMVWNLIKVGDPVPDQLVMTLIAERLNKLDCKINGWILDGFPGSAAQLDYLKKLQINPSLVILLEVSDHIVYERLEHRRFDPVEGKHYNTMLDPPKEEAILCRLVQSDEDNHPTVKKR